MPALIVESGPSAAQTPAQLETATGVPERVFTSIRAGVADWMIMQNIDAAAGAIGVTRGQLKAAYRQAHTRVWGRTPHASNNKPALMSTHSLAQQAEGTNL